MLEIKAAKKRLKAVQSNACFILKYAPFPLVTNGHNLTTAGITMQSL